jgi:hypothetical protein
MVDNPNIPLIIGSYCCLCVCVCEGDKQRLFKPFTSVDTIDILKEDGKE